jgi:hypothetical protein
LTKDPLELKLTDAGITVNELVPDVNVWITKLFTIETLPPVAR